MTLYHEEFGQGKPLVICHGFLGSSSNWRQVAKRLGSYFHVYTLDLRNHGMSFHHPDCGYQAMAADVLEFMNRKRLESPILLGHSMGGKVVMQTAADAGEFSIDKLVVVDIAPRTYDDRYRLLLEALCRLSLGNLSSVTQLDAVLKLDVADPALRGFLLKNIVKQADGFKWKINLEGLRAGYSLIAAAPQLNEGIDIPSLFVRGELSDYIRIPEDDCLIATYFSDYRLHTISGAGHWVHVEAFEPFLAAVLDFLCDN